jgi:hypothetical protein
MESWAEARKTAESLSNFFLKLKEAEEIFVKAAEAEQRIPKVLKETEKAVKESKRKQAEAYELTQSSVAVMASINKQIAEAKAELKRIAERVLKAKNTVNRDIDNISREGLDKRVEIEKEMKEFQADARKKIDALQDSVTEWETKLAIAKQDYDKFIKFVTR